MKYAIHAFPTTHTASITDVARWTEELGFDALLLPDHTHIPASRETDYPQGRPLPPEYAQIHDPFIAATAAAMVTERIKIGTGVCVVVERDPIVTAKLVAGVDHMSDGRFLFGVGAGWNREEMRNHGTDPRTRIALMKERVEAMKAIWTQDEASYHGTFVNFDAIWCWPKPVQAPHPPILMGGNVPAAVERALEYADGWYPAAGRDESVDDELLGQIADVKRRTAGRDFPVTVSDLSADPVRLGRYRDAGTDRVTFVLESGTRDEVRAAMEQLAELVSGVEA
jgi:probable F420-dependent oxidoreductase